MPRGPKGEKRPADLIGNAVKVAKIATGEIEDTEVDEPIRERAKKGAAARKTKLSPEERSEIARIAANARWKKKD